MVDFRFAFDPRAVRHASGLILVSVRGFINYSVYTVL